MRSCLKNLCSSIEYTVRIILIILLLNFIAHAQEKTDVKKLQKFADEKQSEWQTNRTEAETFARSKNLPIRKEFPDGTIIEIQRIQNGVPIYYITNNLGAAQTTRTDELWPGGILGLSLTGSGYSQLGEWDGGAVRTTHQELSGRVTQIDAPSSQSSHSTHVAGTMIATGVVADAKGMAYQGNLDAYDWNNDVSEMASAASGGLEISNHSYGIISGWYTPNGFTWYWYGTTSISTEEDYRFGFYDSEAQSWDQIAYDAPYYLIVKSAGNDRDDYYSGSHIHAEDGLTYTDSHPVDGGSNGYDCISSAGVAKNILTVGAINEIQEYSDPADVVMSSFSGWGPADDGRIKPDIVAKGVQLYSSTASADDAYSTYSGTSMSSPNTAGSLVLLQQHYQNTHSGSSMRSATLKGLVIHTADEAGDYTGPDYQFGWGLLNTKKAAQLITEDTKQNVIDELSLSNGGSYSRTVTASGGTPLKVTLVWTDPPGTPLSASLDPPDPMLVNDLDLKITKNGTTYYPWKLDNSSPENAPTQNTENNIDNVEQVFIDEPLAGNYSIEIDHDGSLNGGSQAFSLIISGIDEFSNPPGSCSADLIAPADGATDVSLTTRIEWEPVEDASSYDLYFGTDGGGTTTPTNIVNGQTQSSNIYYPDLNSNTTYYVQVVPRNNQGTATGCTTIWSFTTGIFNKVSSFPFTEDFESFGGIGSGNDWQNSSEDDFDWTVDSDGTTSSGTGPDADHTTGGSGNYLYTEASSPNYPTKRADLLTPLLDISSLSNPTLEFWYHMYGDDMGDLYLDVYDDNTWHLNVFHKSGQQSADGNDWKVATVDLSPYSTSSTQQLRFRGVTGGGWSSDIAIDDVTIRGEEFHTFPAGDNSPYTFPNSGAIIEFINGNSGEVTIQVVKFDDDPGTYGDLPGTVINVSSERYWDISVLSGTVDDDYHLSLDLAGMTGINNYSTLYLLQRDSGMNPWNIAGTNAYSGSGTTVQWTDITSGFSEFGIGGEGDNPLPVSLTSFKAELGNQEIILHWITESEVENEAFILERSLDSVKYNLISEIPGHGNSTTQHAYKYVDKRVQHGRTYHYRLADRDFSGRITYHPAISVTFEHNLPTEFALHPNFPNPFNPVTHIQFDLPATDNKFHKIKLSIYNSLGQKVIDLFSGELSPGYHEVQWDGTNQNGVSVSSGIYYLNFDAENYIKTQKMLLLR